MIIEGVKHLLAVAAIGDQVLGAEQAEVMGDGWLGEAQLLAKTADIALALGQNNQNLHSGFIGEKSKQLDKGFEFA